MSPRRLAGCTAPDRQSSPFEVTTLPAVRKRTACAHERPTSSDPFSLRLSLEI